MKTPNLLAVALLILAGTSRAAMVNWSGKVVDPAGKPISGVLVKWANTTLQSETSGDGTWSFSVDWTGIGLRVPLRKIPRWTGRAVELALDVPATVSIEAYDIGGVSHGRMESMRLDAGLHSIPMNLRASGMTVLKVVVNGRTETILASSGFVRSKSREVLGIQAMLGPSPAGRTSAVPTDTLLFQLRYRTQARVLLSKMDSSGIVVVIDTATFRGAYGFLDDARDGQKYRTVKIGNQTWMAENLNFKPSGADSGWRAGPVGATGYGRLYNWSTALALPADCNTGWCEGRNPGMFFGDKEAISPAVHQTREGICPQGWHVPSLLDWDTLLVRTGCGGEKGDWLWTFPCLLGLAAGHGWTHQGGGTDSFGFGVMPAGYRHADDTTERIGTRAQFWLTAESDVLGDYAKYSSMTGDASSMWVAFDESMKSVAMSLRCIEGAATLDTSTTLASLSVDVGSLSSPFAPSVLSYIDTIPIGINAMTIVAKTVSPNAFTVSSFFPDYYGRDSNAVGIHADSTIQVQVFNSGRSRTYTIKPVYKPVDPARFGTLVDTRAGGQTYRTVKIGTQNWMAENLNFAVDSSWWYMDSEDSGRKYGRLYAWPALMDLPDSCQATVCASQIQPKHRGICPSGWHVPSQGEWNALENAVGGAENAYGNLKSKTGWENDGNGTDAVGFHLLPAGYRWLSAAGFEGAGYATSILTTDPSSSGGMNAMAYSARCLQD